MNRSELIKIIAARHKGMSALDIDLAVKSIVTTMAEALQSGKRVEFRAFGTFEMRTRKPYTAYNPPTGQVVSVPQRRIARFKPSIKLRGRVDYSEASIHNDNGNLLGKD